MLASVYRSVGCDIIFGGGGDLFVAVTLLKYGQTHFPARSEFVLSHHF